MAFGRAKNEKTRGKHTKAAARALVLVLGGAACSGRAKPARAPVPVPTPKSVATTSPTRDATPALPDSIPQVVIVIPDSVLTRQAVAVFGDSAVADAPDSAANDGPTWDIDVRSYETHRRVERCECRAADHREPLDVAVGRDAEMDVYRGDPIELRPDGRTEPICAG